jgi:hypothetical protein
MRVNYVALGILKFELHVVEGTIVGYGNPAMALVHSLGSPKAHGSREPVVGALPGN